MRFKTTWINRRSELGVHCIDTVTGDEYKEFLSKTSVWVGDEGSLVTVLELNAELFKDRQLKKFDFQEE